MTNPFEQGYQSNYLSDNPYWKNYPKESLEQEQIYARVWVDGYVRKIIESKES